MGVIRGPALGVCLVNGKYSEGPSVFRPDPALRSVVDFPGVILLSFQRDIKLIIFTRGKN